MSRDLGDLEDSDLHSLREEILTLVKQSPDQREKGLLLLLYQIEGKVGVTSKAVFLLVKNLEALTKSFEAHVKEEMETYNKGRGFWKAALLFFSLVQGIVGYFGVQFIESYNKVLVQAIELREASIHTNKELDALKDLVKTLNTPRR